MGRCCMIPPPISRQATFPGVSTALDIEAAGVDRDSGAGIVMALQALGAVSSADLAITKADSPDPVIAGTDLTYTIKVSNNGSGPAVFARWQDTLPAGTRLQSFSPADGWSCVTPPIGSVGAVATVTFGTTAICALADGALISNTATIAATEIDPNPANNSASSTTTAINPPPVISLNPFISLWPPNHKYPTVTVAQMVQSVTANCPISVADVVIQKVASDEPCNALGDGNTIDDIAIGANCRSVQLRAERAGPGDGRVYTITLRVRDSGGAVTRAVFEVSVPHSQNGAPAVKGVTAFTVISSCQ